MEIKGASYVVTLRNAGDFDLLLCEVHMNDISGKMYSINFEIENEKIEIVEIGGYINRGYGTELMKCLILYAREHRIKEIWGKLFPTDINDHKERLFHFYQKFGFEILDTKSENNKKIKLRL